MQNEPESLTSSDMPLSLTSFVNPSTTRRAPFIWQELPTQIAGSFGPDGVFNPNNLGYDLEGVYVRGNNNGFLHSDGWDRIKNFRERKAELYFHNGGMEYAEDM